MEVLELLDLACCFLEMANGGAIVADAVAWKKSRENRREIRQAKRFGVEPPGWTTAFQILTPMVITLTVLLAIKWARRI